MIFIEIDGDSHFGQEAYDKKRQKRLEELGVTILRFGDSQVKEDVHGVVEEIKDWIINNA